MAKIIGNLRPDDDYPHPLGCEPNFNESMYFNFFDRARSVGGFLRIGNRANEGHAERTVAVFLPDGRVLFDFQRPAISSNDRFDAGGLRFDVLEPAQRLRTTFAGDVLELRDPLVMTDPWRAFVESPRLRVELDLVHEAVGPMYGSSHDESEAGQSAERQFAKAHYEQHMHVTGTLELGSSVSASAAPGVNDTPPADDAAAPAQAFGIDGFGLRDHSWGPRFWQALHSYEWLTMSFGRDFGAMVSIVRRADGDARVGGVVVRGDDADFLDDASIEIDYGPDGLEHRALRVEACTRRGERLSIHGEVLSFLPLRNRRAGMMTHVGEGMTRWRCGDREGYGMSELLRQV